MASQILLILVVAACPLLAAGASACTTAANSSTAATERTAYDMVVQKGFPVGILPRGVRRYRLKPDSSFEVEFPDDCMFYVDGDHSFFYDTRVAGSIRTGTMKELAGMLISIKEAPGWRAVSRVDRDGEHHLAFHVPGHVEKVAVAHFSVSPICL